jgi:hypothetical protein
LGAGHLETYLVLIEMAQHKENLDRVGAGLVTGPDPIKRDLLCKSQQIQKKPFPPHASAWGIHGSIFMKQVGSVQIPQKAFIEILKSS